jgi:hypothetical protein
MHMRFATDDDGRNARPRQSNGQTRKWSAIESCSTMLVGYFTAVAVYQLLWPLFGYQVHITESASVALLMFPVNYARQYLVRRAFNWLEHRGGVDPHRVDRGNDPSSPFD